MLAGLPLRAESDPAFRSPAVTAAAESNGFLSVASDQVGLAGNVLRKSMETAAGKRGSCDQSCRVKPCLFPSVLVDTDVSDLWDCV